MIRKTVSIDEIKPDPLNPRDNERTVALLRASLPRFGQCGEIVVDKTGKILAGHARYEAAKLEGIKELDVVVFVGSDREARSFALDDNFSAEVNRQDTREVVRMLEDIEKSGSDALHVGFDDVARKKLREKLERAKPAKTRKIFNIIIDCVSEEEMIERAEHLQESGYRVKRDIK